MRPAAPARARAQAPSIAKLRRTFPRRRNPPFPAPASASKEDRLSRSSGRQRRRSRTIAAALVLGAGLTVSSLTAVSAAHAATVTGVTGQITGLAGKCVDDAGGSANNGNPIQLYDCNGTASQNWYVGSDGTLRLGGPDGKCMDVTNGQTTDGTKIQLYDCNGTGAQQWQPQSGGALLNPQSGRCLDLPSASAVNGRQLQIYDCNGTAAQTWTLPSGQPLAVSPQNSDSTTLGVAAGLRPSASGGDQPYQWSATGLPPGMSVNYVNGNVQGTPTAVGSYTATLTATDVTGATASTTFTWSVTAPSAGTSWYLDCSASANGTGTESSPWNSLSSASAHTFSPGDSLLLKRGSTCTGQLAPLGSGTATAPITIDAYGTGPAPVVAGNGVAGSPVVSGGPSVGGGAVQLTNQSYWIIQDLAVTNTASGAAQRDGIDVLITDGAEHDGITIRDNEVSAVTGVSDHGSDFNGFYLSHSIGVDTPVDGGFVKGLTIADNYIHDSLGNGIGIYGDQGTGNNNNSVEDQQVLVSGNTIEAVSNDGVVVCVSDSPLVQDNTADQLGENAVDAQNIAGIWGWSDNNPTFQYNEVSNINAPGNDMEAWDCDGYIAGTCTYQDNYDHDNSGGIFLQCAGCGGSDPTDIVYRYNVSVNDCRINNYTGDLASFSFYNNTIDCQDQAWNFTVPSQMIMANNIFVGQSGSTLPANATYLANTYVGSSPPTSDWMASTADPRFAAPGTANYGLSTLGGYQLSAGSPALGTGTAMPGEYGQDLWGNPVAGTPNRGAYAAAGTGTPARTDDTAATYSGSWSTGDCSGCLGGSNHYTDSAGASAQFTVTGSTISVYASQTNLNGFASVSIDGGTAVPVDLYTPGSDSYGQLVYTSPRLSNGPHTVTITDAGQADPRGDGTYISLDSYTVAG